MNGIGRNLKRIRLLKNLSLKDAGNLLNMTATAISKYEKGEILPDSKKIIVFSNAYNVKTIDLLKVYDAPKMNFTSLRYYRIEDLYKAIGINECDLCTYCFNGKE